MQISINYSQNTSFYHFQPKNNFYRCIKSCFSYLEWNKGIIISGWNFEIQAIVLFCTYYVLHSIVTKWQCTGQKLLIYYKSSKKKLIYCQKNGAKSPEIFNTFIYKNMKIWKHQKKTCEMAWHVIKWILAVEPSVGN